MGSQDEGSVVVLICDVPAKRALHIAKAVTGMRVDGHIPHIVLEISGWVDKENVRDGIRLRYGCVPERGGSLKPIASGKG
jgi:hypothetical protein